MPWGYLHKSSFISDEIHLFTLLRFSIACSLFWWINPPLRTNCTDLMQTLRKMLLPDMNVPSEKADAKAIALGLLKWRQSSLT